MYSHYVFVLSVFTLLEDTLPLITDLLRHIYNSMHTCEDIHFTFLLKYGVNNIRVKGQLLPVSSFSLGEKRPPLPAAGLMVNIC